MLQAAIAATLDGVEEDDIGDTTCDDSRRRLSGSSHALRRRLDDGGGAVISFDITVTADTLSTIAGSDDDAGFVDASSVIATALTSAVSSGALADNIATAAAESGNTAMTSVVVASVSATASESYEAVSGIGCDEYYGQDDDGMQNGQFGDVYIDSAISLEACAAAVKSFSGCDDAEYFFYEWGGICHCPTGECSAGENNNAGNGVMYKFVDTASTRNFVAVSDQGCDGEYVDMYYEFTSEYYDTDLQALATASTTTPEECAAAVRAADGIGGCRAEYFGWTFQGGCYCPMQSDGIGFCSSGADFISGSGQLYKFSDGYVSSIADCSSSYCTSTDGSAYGTDCWAGSSSESCSCSLGEARETGRVHESLGTNIYEYTCCSSGDNEGEECGDCCTSDSAVASAMILIGAGVGGFLFLLCCGCIIGYVIYSNSQKRKAPQSAMAIPQQALAVALPAEPSAAIEMAVVTAADPVSDRKLKASLQL